ncbi:MAG: ABC transporter permease [Patescibacteria group bacterium]|mgnify:CR=1 FL=1
MNRLFALLSLALRDTSKSGINFFLTILSLTALFAALFTTAGILEGFKTALTDGAIGSSGHIIITPGENNTFISDFDIENISKELNSIDNIEAFNVRSVIMAVGTSYKGKMHSPYRVVGFSPKQENKVTGFEDKIVQGRNIVSSRNNEAVLGLTIADSLVGYPYDKDRIKIGETINIVATDGTNYDYKVVGIADFKTFLPNWVVYLDKEALEKLDDSQKNSEIVIKLKDLDKIEQTKKEIQEKNLNVHVATWREDAGYIDDLLSGFSLVMNMVINFFLAVTFIIIAMVIFIHTIQRRRQIGIIKSMGGGDKFVITVYILEAFIYSTLSFVLGGLIFVLIHQYFAGNPIVLLIGDLRTVINYHLFWISFWAYLGATLLGSAVPAYLASKTKIVDVMRGSI